MLANQDKFKQLINELDESVSKDEAKVTFSQYGGDNSEAMIVGNQQGYLRLGIEFLKAAFAPSHSELAKKDPHAIDVNLDYLLTEDSDIQFDWFQRREDIPVKEEASNGWSEKFVAWGCLGLIGLIFILASIGLKAVSRWVLSGTPPF